MTAVRTASAALLVTGLGIGTLTPGPTPRTDPIVNGYTILTADFHVHAFPGDGALTPARLREQAARYGIDVITITNHNQLYAARLMRRTERPGADPIVILGTEITNPQYHLIAVGISQFVNWDQPAARAIDDVHAQGGIAIAAHPMRDYRQGWDDEAVARLDGVEAAHPSRGESDETARDFAEFVERARTLKPDIAPIGSSDFHVHDRLGRCRTYVFVRERSAAGVLAAVRAGRTVAETAEGHLFGDAALVKIVEETRSATPAEPGVAFSAVFAWLGVAGLMLSCPVRRRGAR
jgi:predicted metal-dependent phosphoesterase TrpH